jgi:transposase-like protein
MARPTRKRKAISLETKYEIIQCVEMGNESKKDAAARFDILPNTLSTILKKRKNCGIV